MDVYLSIIADESQLTELVHEKLTRDPVAPIISGRVSWLTLTSIGRGLPSFPKCASRSRSHARRFSLELNNWSIRSSSMRLLRVNR